MLENFYWIFPEFIEGILNVKWSILPAYICHYDYKRRINFAYSILISILSAISTSAKNSLIFLNIFSEILLIFLDFPRNSCNHKFEVKPGNGIFNTMYHFIRRCKEISLFGSYPWVHLSNKSVASYFPMFLLAGYCSSLGTSGTVLISQPIGKLVTHFR